MKKLHLISLVSIFTIFLLLLFTSSYSQNVSTETKPNCKNSSRKIPEDSIVKFYAPYYRALVAINPLNAIQQLIFTTSELSCLAKLPSGDVKFIIGAYDCKNDLTVFIIVETSENGKPVYYDLDD